MCSSSSVASQFGKIDVHLAHLHAVLARVADELGRGVEAHGLGIQQAAQKTSG